MPRLDVPRVVVSARAPARTGKTRNEPSTLPVRRAGPATPPLRCPACRVACLGQDGRTLGAAFDGRLECAACGETFGVLPDSTPDSLAWFRRAASGAPTERPYMEAEPGMNHADSSFAARSGRTLLPLRFRRVLAVLPFPIRTIAGVLLLALDLAARSTLVAWKGR